MRGRSTDLGKLDIEVLAVDPHEKWAAKHMLKSAGFDESELRVPLLLDPSLTISATYGVAFQMRIHTEISNRPTTFIIDKQGKIRYARRAKTFFDRPRVSEIISKVKSFK